MIVLTPELLRVHPTGSTSRTMNAGLADALGHWLRLVVGPGSAPAGSRERIAGILPPCAAPCPTLRPDLAAAMLPLINADRAKIGEPAVAVDPRLVACEEWKVLNCAAQLYLDHDDHGVPYERPWSTRFADYYPVDRAAFGENIAYGFVDAAGVMQAFLSDIGHRQDVEGPWVGVGLAVAQASNGLLFWGQAYGSAPVGPPPPPPPPVPSGSVLDHWLSNVLPLLSTTSQYKAWRANTKNRADVAAWDAFLAAPHGARPKMATPLGRFLVADLALAAAS